MDPIRTISMRLRATRTLALVLAMAIGVWALVPLKAISIDRPDLHPETTAPDQDHSQDAWDESAFAAVIWHAPPKIEPPREAEQTQTVARHVPLKIELIAIVTAEDGTRMAALYDPDADAIHIVASGESIGAFTVESIDPPRVTLAQGRELHTITLEREGGPQSPWTAIGDPDG